MKRTIVTILSVAIIACISTSALAGSKTGPRRWKRKLTKNQEVVYKVAFKANETAEFAFIGDGSTDLDLFITDVNGKKVSGGFDTRGRPSNDGRDFFTTDIALIRWVPTRTQTYVIRIKPYTSGENEVYFGHN